MANTHRNNEAVSTEDKTGLNNLKSRTVSTKNKESDTPLENESLAVLMIKKMVHK